MNTKKILETLQLICIGEMIDSFINYQGSSSLEEVLSRKIFEQKAMATDWIKAFSLNCADDVFRLFESLYGYAEWEKCTSDEEIFFFVAKCRVRDIANLRGVPAPCNFICCNPISILCERLKTPVKIDVASTLFDCNKCTFKINNIKK